MAKSQGGLHGSCLVTRDEGTIENGDRQLSYRSDGESAGRAIATRTIRRKTAADCNRRALERPSGFCTVAAWSPSVEVCGQASSGGAGAGGG